jgi:hypothetical protein
MNVAARVQPFLEKIGFQFKAEQKTSLFSEVAVNQFQGNH